jgi:protein TonB
MVALALVSLWLLVPAQVAAGDVSKPATDPDEKLPSMDEMVVVDENAQVISRAKPHYSKMAQIAGLEGVVWIKALVGKDGAVRDAVIYKSSESAVLDRSALEAAFKSTYKPAIKKNQPVAVWVTYRVDFKLKS